MVYLLGQIGSRIDTVLVSFKDIFQFTTDTTFSLFQTRRENIDAAIAVVVNQIYFTGLQAMPILGSIALLLGSLVCFQALPYLIDVGATEFIGVIFVVSIVRELGPLFTAIVVICRSGAAISAELSTNKVNLELEALESMGVDLYHFIVLPRVLGMAISMVALTVYFNALALFGGFFVGSSKLGLNFSSYVRHIISALEFRDIYISLFKSLIFGLLVAVLCTYYGMKAGRASTEIPQVVARGVIQSVLLTIALNFVVSAAVYY